MEAFIIIVLAGACGLLLMTTLVARSDYESAAERLERLQFANPYAKLLGRTVEAKVYAESRWERMVVVAVSWHGAVCVRPESDMKTKGRWIASELTPSRVREISEWETD